MVAIKGRGGHDRHIYLKDGIMMMRVWPHKTFKVSDQKLDDGKWHQVELDCTDGLPIRTYIDGKATNTNDKGDQSNFDWANRVNFGWSQDKGKEFTGSIKNFHYLQHEIKEINYSPIKFDSNRPEDYAHLKIEYDDKNVEEFDGVYKFDKGFAHLYSNKLRILDHPKTGLPNKNFKISFKFKTSQDSAPLFSMDAIKGRGGHDRHIYLDNGIMMMRVWPHGKFKVSDQKLDDDEWHQVELHCRDK